MAVAIVRRDWLKSIGLSIAALALGATFDTASEEPAGAAIAVGLGPNPFVHIAPDGAVTIVCHRSEMGQGIRSTLPALIADELGADPARVTIKQADGDPKYGSQDTDGSSSIRTIYEAMRRVGATARQMLIAVAAERWGVSSSSCTAHDHAVFHEQSGRSFGFGALAVDASKLRIPDAKELTLRPDAEMKHVFRAMPLVDGLDYVTGRALYGADVRLPGMLVAVIARPPVVGGRVKSFDATAALATPGVRRVIELPALHVPYHFKPLGGVAVLADNTWAAMKGRAALSIAWDDGENASLDSASYHDELFASVRAPGDVVRTVGDVDKALAGATRTIEGEYFNPHLAHAPMEPPAAVASVTGDGGDRCEIWAATQNPQAAQQEAAKAIETDVNKVTVHVTFLGGGFGRKSKPDYVAEAAFLSKEAGVPVRVQWTRPDDIQHDYFHSTCANRLVAGLDSAGKVTSWLHRNAFPSIKSTFVPFTTHADIGELGQGMLDFPLAVPNVRAENCAAKAHVRIGWLRSVHNINYAFAVNSFIDEIAHARGDDPRDVFLEIIGEARTLDAKALGVAKVPNYGAPLDQHPIDVGRLRRVVERVTESAGWSASRKNGRALGLAAHRSFLTYVAVVVSVVKESNGKLRVDEAWVAADAGTIVNLDRANAQMEGALVFGISIALHGAVTMKGGVVQQTNFRDYKVARIGEVPREIHVDWVPSTGRPGGIGEPGVPPVAPAICNAVFAATGVRVRELPLSRMGLV